MVFTIGKEWGPNGLSWRYQPQLEFSVEIVLSIWLWRLWLRKQVWIATRWSGHIRMERRSTVTQMISNEFDLCEQVWIRVVDQGYGSLVRRGYGSGPYILSCVHRYWRNTLFCNVHLQIKISLTCIRIFLYSGQKVYNFICLSFLHLVTSSSHVHFRYGTRQTFRKKRGNEALAPWDSKEPWDHSLRWRFAHPPCWWWDPRDSGKLIERNKKKLRHYWGTTQVQQNI